MKLPSTNNNKPDAQRLERKEVIMKKQTILAALLSLTAAMCTSTVRANVRVNIPEGNEPPFYARISGYEFIGSENIFRTEEWAAIVFYREPECVPAGFNLL